jgi:3-dehydroquinate dehydratase-2
MNNVLLLHGVNLNALGRRDPRHYGTASLDELVERVREWATERGLTLRHEQSNHEGDLVDALQEQREWADGALINAGAWTHTSYALHDALVDFGKPVVEVHLSEVSEREAWRRVSVLRPACVAHVEGRGVEGYRVALDRLMEAWKS